MATASISRPPKRARRAPVTRPPAAARGAVRAAARATASSVYRDAILAAASHEFTDRGYAATRMLDVARRAGMSVGALYRHFENKEAIFVSLMDVASERVTDRMGEVASTISDPRERIARLIEAMLTFIEENRGMFLVFHQLADADRAQCHAMVEHSDSTRGRILSIYRAAIADGVAAGALRDDVAPDDQLSFLTGAIHGFLEGWMRSDGETGLVAKAPLIARLTLRALGGTP
jgi:AcrR family transcriptional regulator